MIWKLLPSFKGSQKDGKEYRTKKKQQQTNMPWHYSMICKLNQRIE